MCGLGSLLLAWFLLRSCLALGPGRVADWADMGDSLGQLRSGRGDDSIFGPAEYLAHLVNVSGRFRVRPEQLLKGTGVKPASLERPSAVVSRASFLRVVERALELTGEPGLGFYWGLSLKLSSHGGLGLLAMTSGTLRDAILVVERFMQLRASELSLCTHRRGRRAGGRVPQPGAGAPARVFQRGHVHHAAARRSRAGGSSDRGALRAVVRGAGALSTLRAPLARRRPLWAARRPPAASPPHCSTRPCSRPTA